MKNNIAALFFAVLFPILMFFSGCAEEAITKNVTFSLPFEKEGSVTVNSHTNKARVKFSADSVLELIYTDPSSLLFGLEERVSKDSAESSYNKTVISTERTEMVSGDIFYIFSKIAESPLDFDSAENTDGIYKFTFSDENGKIFAFFAGKSGDLIKAEAFISNTEIRLNFS